jgi:hypothetical protein
MVVIFTLGKYSSISKDYNNVVQVIEKCLENKITESEFISDYNEVLKSIFSK